MLRAMAPGFVAVSTGKKLLLQMSLRPETDGKFIYDLRSSCNIKNVNDFRHEAHQEERVAFYGLQRCALDVKGVAEVGTKWFY